jgi:hypothetical protein
LIAKLSPSASSSWAELALLSLLNSATHPVKVSKQHFTVAGWMKMDDDLNFFEN